MCLSSSSPTLLAVFHVNVGQLFACVYLLLYQMLFLVFVHRRQYFRDRRLCHPQCFAMRYRAPSSLWFVVQFMLLKSMLQFIGVDWTVTSWKCWAVFSMLLLWTVKSFRVLLPNNATPPLRPWGSAVACRAPSPRKRLTPLYLYKQHIDTRLTALFPGLPGWAGTRKVKPIWILVKQETVSGSGIIWAICKSALRSRQITTSAPITQFLQAVCPSCRPTNSIKALKARLYRDEDMMIMILLVWQPIGWISYKQSTV